MTFSIGRFAPLALATLALAACPSDSEDTGGSTGDSGSATMGTMSATTAMTTAPSDSSDSGSETAPVDVDYVTDIQPIWAASCTAGCHEAGGIYAALDLTSAASYAALTMGTPVYGTNPFVEPGAPEDSLLVEGLRGTALTLRQMPLLLDDSVMPPVGVAGTPLAEGDIAKVEAWIMAGANP